jgi:arsenate reductase
MAEGWGRSLFDDSVEVYSAGVLKTRLDPRAVVVMAEKGIDISHQFSKSIDELPPKECDAVITLCDQAHESCPFFSGNVKRLHQGFDDPPTLASGEEDEESALDHYRRVRDEISSYVANLPKIIMDIS